MAHQCPLRTRSAARRLQRRRTTSLAACCDVQRLAHHTAAITTAGGSSSTAAHAAAGLAQQQQHSRQRRRGGRRRGGTAQSWCANALATRTTHMRSPAMLTASPPCCASEPLPQVRLTLIARVSDGLPLAEGLDKDEAPEMRQYDYKGQAKVGSAVLCWVAVGVVGGHALTATPAAAGCLRCKRFRLLPRNHAALNTTGRLQARVGDAPQCAGGARRARVGPLHVLLPHRRPRVLPHAHGKGAWACRGIQLK